MTSILSRYCCAFQYIFSCRPYYCKPLKEARETQTEEDTYLLDNIEYANTQIFIPPITEGKVVKVYDADTITVATRMPKYSPDVFRFNVRLNSIDTPEIKSKNATTKARALHARDVVKEMVYGKIVQLKNVSLEKYGRILADVYIEDIHLNKWLIDNGYAVTYSGGTKHIPEDCEQLL